MRQAVQVGTCGLLAAGVLVVAGASAAEEQKAASAQEPGKTKTEQDSIGWQHGLSPLEETPSKSTSAAATGASGQVQEKAKTSQGEITWQHGLSSFEEPPAKPAVAAQATTSKPAAVTSAAKPKASTPSKTNAVPRALRSLEAGQTPPAAPPTAPATESTGTPPVPTQGSAGQ